MQSVNKWVNGGNGIVMQVQLLPFILNEKHQYIAKMDGRMESKCMNKC